MAVDLGLNTLIAAVKNLPGNATGFADNVIAVLESFKSDDSNNNFGSAALKDVGVESGDVPELTVGGKLVSERLPGASTTQKGAVQLASAEQANALTDTTAALTPGTLPVASPTQHGVVELANTSSSTDTGSAVTPALLETRINAIAIPAAGVTAVTVNNTTSSSGSGDVVQSVTTTLSGSISGTRLTITLNTHTVRGDVGGGGPG